MRELRAGELARLIGARLVGDPSTPLGPDVVIDSRVATPGCVFVALPGERVDGHDFAADSCRRRRGGCPGHAAARSRRCRNCWSRTRRPPLPPLPPRWWHEARAAGLVSVGITGSSGKTSTKDLHRPGARGRGADGRPGRVLQQRDRRPADRHPDRRRHPLPGQRDGRPRPGAHRLAVRHRRRRRSGWSSTSATPTSASSARWRRSPRPRASWSRRCPPTAGRCSTPTTRWSPRMAGRTAGTDRRRSRSAPNPAAATCGSGRPRSSADALQRPAFTLHAAGARRPATAAVQLRVHGRAPGGQRPGRRRGRASPRASASTTSRPRLGRATARSRWRMELSERADGVLVVNDAYNANPDSMAAALRTLAVPAPSRRAAAGRPGRHARARPGRGGGAHGAIGALAAELGVDATAGGRRRSLPTWWPVRPPGRWTRGAVADREEAAAAADGWLRPADVVLVKASRGLALETVADHLYAPRGGRTMRSILLAGAIGMLGTLLGTRYAIRFLVEPRLRPVHPRRRSHQPPHQARHARRWAAS